LDRARRPGVDISAALPDAPFASPLHHLALVSAVAEGRDNETAPLDAGLVLTAYEGPLLQ